jgi:hypothetical protein
MEGRIRKHGRASNALRASAASVKRLKGTVCRPLDSARIGGVLPASILTVPGLMGELCTGGLLHGSQGISQEGEG